MAGVPHPLCPLLRPPLQGGQSPTEPGVADPLTPFYHAFLEDTFCGQINALMLKYSHG